jgi:uncharacterized protein (DUF58 family)
MIGPALIFVIVFTIFLALIFSIKNAGCEGKVILAFAALSLTAFYRLHYYLLLFTAFALFGFIAVAVLWALFASMRISLKREIKNEALVDENVPVTYKVTSFSPLPLYHVRVWDRLWRGRAAGNEEQLSFEDPGYVGFLRIRRTEWSEAMIHFVPPVRGVLHFGPVGVEGGDPFGLFTFIRWLPVGDECLVLPTWLRMSALPSIPARLGTREQDRLISREGQSHELLGVRAYAEGDNLRRVHWPLTAKHDELIVRQFEREVEEEMLVILDVDRRADIGDGAENALEYLITLASSIIHTASDMAKPWTFVIVGKTVDTFTHRAKESLLNVQYALARLEASREDPIENYLEKIRKEYPSSACALLTARTDPGPAAALSRIDSMIGEGVHSMLIRVDTDTFQGGIDDAVRAMIDKRRTQQTPSAAKVSELATSRIPQITVSRGDNISELFLGRTRV